MRLADQTAGVSCGLSIANDPCVQKDKHNDAKNDPVKSKDLKAVFLKIIYKEPDGQQCNNEGDHRTDAQRGHIISYQHFRMFLINIIKTFCGGSKHGRERQEEKKFCSEISRQLLGHSTYNGCSATAKSWKKYRQHLQTSNNKGFWKGNIFFFSNC